MEKGYSVSQILGFVGLASSTYYEFIAREAEHNKGTSEGQPSIAGSSHSGRPIPEYTFTRDGRKLPDEQIKEWLCEVACGDGFPYGYRKLTVCLREDYDLLINHKKVYRLCKELDILRPQRRVKQRHPRRLAKRDTVSGPNQLWEMDMKYGYIQGIDEFFFQLSLIDVFDRCVIDYHLGLSCTASDACRVLKKSLQIRAFVNVILIHSAAKSDPPALV